VEVCLCDPCSLSVCIGLAYRSGNVQEMGCSMVPVIEHLHGRLCYGEREATVEAKASDEGPARIGSRRGVVGDGGRSIGCSCADGEWIVAEHTSHAVSRRGGNLRHQPGDVLCLRPGERIARRAAAAGPARLPRLPGLCRPRLWRTGLRMQRLPGLRRRLPRLRRRLWRLRRRLRTVLEIDSRRLDSHLLTGQRLSRFGAAGWAKSPRNACPRGQRCLSDFAHASTPSVAPFPTLRR
jgi:hypothetical protein